MTVEDLLLYMFQRQYDFSFGEWELNFIKSVGHHPIKGRALSTRQGESVLRIGKKYRKTIFVPGSVESLNLDSLLKNPVYRIDPFVSEMFPREVRYAGDNLLAFRFKMNEDIARDIKSLNPRTKSGTGGQAVFFAKKQKVWIVPVVLGNVERTQSIISLHDFGYDDAVLALLADVASTRGVAPQVFCDPEGDRIILATTDDVLLGWFAEHILGGTPL